MSEQNAATRLRLMRERTGLSIRAVAKAIGRSTSGYVFYEREYKKKYLPLELAEELVPVFEERGVDEEAVLSLAGLRYRVDGVDNEQCELEADVDEGDLYAAALGANVDHISLLHPGENVDEGAPYTVTSSHPDYGRIDDMLWAISPRESAFMRLWLLRRSAIDLAGYLPGDLLAVDLSITPRPGDIVCASFPDMGREVTGFRIYSPPFLLTASSSPKNRSPLLIDNLDVRVNGVVMGMCRRRQ